MKTDFHFHFYSRIVIMAVLAVFLVFSNKSVETQAGPMSYDIDITGWAWSESVGWVSLNCNNDFTEPGTLENRCPTFSYGLQSVDVSGETRITGCAWAGSYLNSGGYPMGWVCFSDTDGTTQAPSFGIPTSTTQINALSPSAYASIVGQEQHRCSVSGNICGTGYDPCPGVETCDLVANDAWKLGFPIDDQIFSTIDDSDYPSTNNPLSGCFNCYESYSNYVCSNDPATSCDNVCPSDQAVCEESTGLICPELAPSVYDTCEAQTLANNCDNCLEYFYYSETDDLSYGNGYDYRRSITIDGDDVAGTSDLTDFPVLVSGTYSYLADTGNGGNVESANGYDIIFTSDSDGSSQLDHEIESYDNTTGEIVVWIKLGTLYASRDTTIYMFYGNSSAGDTQDAAGVWSNGYSGVWHLAESSGNYLDSTSSNNDSSNDLSGLSRSNSCQIGSCPLFDGTSDYINFPDDVALDVGTNNFSISAWVSTQSFEDDEGIACKATSAASADTDYCLATSAGEAGFETYIGSGTYQETTGSKNSSWYYLTATYDGGVLPLMYVDGAIDAGSSAGSSNSASNSAAFTIGTWANTRYFDGYIDEVRLSSVSRSAGWTETEYNNQNAPWAFYTIGAERTGYAVGDLKKVLGGYSCTSCTIENFDNICGLNSYAGNVNRCASCNEVYQTPGLMLDHRHYGVAVGETANLCGWGWNGYGTNQGLGWFQFEPRVVTTTRPYISVEGGSIYSKGRLYSRYTPPFNKYSASYLIESGEDITNFISSKTLAGEYQGELPYSSPINFFDLQGNGKYENALGSIDYQGLITTIGGTSYNKYDAEVVEFSDAGGLLTELANPLDNRVLRVNASAWLGSPIEIQSGTGSESGAGVIIIEGSLIIGANIEYDDNASASFSNLKNIPSVVWLVKGDVYIAPTVDTISGTFIVVGTGAVASCGQPSSCDVTSITTGADTGCGQFATCYEVTPGDCDQSSLQLTVNGNVISRLFELCRGYYDPAVQEPAEKFINNGRLQANPPPGFTDFSKVIPRFY